MAPQLPNKVMSSSPEPKPRRARIADLGDNPIRSTLLGIVQQEAGDRVRSLGMTLKDSEIARLGDLAARLSVSRNALVRFLVRYALAELEAGRLIPETKETVQVKLELPYGPR